MKKQWPLGLNKNQSIALILIFATVFGATYANLRVSLRRSRDAQRKADLRAIANGLESYFGDFASFPQDFEGKIVACSDGRVNEDDFPILIACDWHQSSLEDVSDPAYPAYLERIPTDPHHNQGARYYYLSNGRYFQVYAALESSSEDEYQESIVNRNLPCGDSICNAGLGFRETPLDKSIEEYENELRLKQKDEQTVQGVHAN